MTILEKARAGKITGEMIYVAEKEGIEPEVIRQGVASGEVVILKSSRENINPVAVGKGLYTKVSASVGMYEKTDTIDGEMAKIRSAVEAQSDTFMDLSICGPIDEMLEKVLSTVDRPVGTLPLYQTLAVAQKKYGTALDMTVEDMFEIVEKQAATGVSFLALHCGTTMDVINRAKEEGRIDPLVSYGGSHLIGWMLHNQCENPFFTQYDRVLEICKKYDVVLSFADGMRPGCIADSLDGAQVQELVILGGLVKKARAAGVQVMVKGPGHVPLDQIQTTIQLQKQLCGGAPYFVFGCLPTDSGVGMDHITGAIGGAVASYYGADFLCYVTPAEHIGLPNVEDVYMGVMASRIAAHAGDVGKGHPDAIAWDREMSVARRELNWDRQMELAIDPETATRIWKERSTDFSSECTMCGEFCAMKVIGKYLREENQEARN